MGKYCTSYMKVTNDGIGKVTVNYCKTHYNHFPDDDIVHLRLPEDIKMCIAAKLCRVCR